MICLVDKEKVEWPQPEYYGQQLYVQVEAGNKQCPPGVHLGSVLLKSLSVTLIKFADDT